MNRIIHMDLPGDWGSLFDQLPGWTKDKNGLWKGTGATCRDNQANHLMQMNGKMSLQTLLPKQIQLSDEVPSSPVAQLSGVQLNHFAVTVPDLDGVEAQAWSRLLDNTQVLRTNKKWDPILEGPLSATHLYVAGSYYVTLREDPAQPMCLHHIGWECKDTEALQAAKRALREAGITTYWEGEIDGSYVIHFEGPDGKIHDFFLVGAPLKRTARRQPKN
jgi:hypothetical protein